MTFNIHLLVDRSPELPYFILAVAYLLSMSPDAVHIFSSAFLFVFTSISVGLLLKICFKMRRPRRHYDIPALCYDFPSLHSMTSVGTIAFVYFVNPRFTVLLLPVGLFYLYSRLKIGVHSMTGVAGGAAIGLVLGSFFGWAMGYVYLPEPVEILFAVLIFCTPLLTAIFRMTYGRRIEDF
ncbi:MAG: hypothetical protein PHG85_07035 [Candidatus Altiarchaeota archaeon]|nr:hypothetical protein [Candidatus Altiarchaeota archaeon]